MAEVIPAEPAITIPKKRSRAISTAVAIALVVASLGVGFAAGRLTAPTFPGGGDMPGIPSGGFPGGGEIPEGGVPEGGFPGGGLPGGGAPGGGESDGGD
jgi:hypothetical protein